MVALDLFADAPSRGRHPPLRRAGGVAAVRGDRPRAAHARAAQPALQPLRRGPGPLGDQRLAGAARDARRRMHPGRQRRRAQPRRARQLRGRRTRPRRRSSSPTRCRRSSSARRPSERRRPRRRRRACRARRGRRRRAGREHRAARGAGRGGTEDARGVSRPTVSVIVPCYGYADVLEGCVASVLAQEGVDVRVLIADDCSPDDTPLVGRRLAESDGRVTYRRNAENQGLIATANAGLAWADGDYVVLLSADDLLVPGSLAAGHHDHGGLARDRDGLRAAALRVCRAAPAGAERALARDRRVEGGGLDPPALPERPQLHLLARGRRAHLGPARRRRV